MGITDGTIGGVSKILDNGPDNSRLNIVLVAEGFQASEAADFNDACDEFVATLQAEPWYPSVGSALNVHRLNVSSTNSGADDPATCGDGNTGSGTLVDTYFDATYCNSNIRRCLLGDNALVRDTLDDTVPEWQAAAVLVNSTERGGCASGNVFWTALSTDWKEVVLHELGHSAFGLADEYETWQGCDSGETDRDNAPPGEPAEPNVTTETDRNLLKWRHLVKPEIPVPTMENPDCAECDRRRNVLSDDLEIGLFEGAKYYHCGRYRPAYRCKMRSSSQPFCRVCLEAIAETLSTYIAATPTLEVVPTYLDFGEVAYDLTLYRSFEVRNRRTGFPGSLDVNLSTLFGQFDYAPGTEASFRLSPPVLEAYTSRQVFVAFTAPEIGGPDFFNSLTVSSADDPANSPISVDLEAHAIPPTPVDSVLVIDRSGSMAEPTGVPGETKVQQAIDAADLYISLLRDSDRVGIVRYNDQSLNPTDILLNLRLANSTGKTAALNQLTESNLAPTGNTSIGAGVLLGSDVLDAAVADSRAVVVLTDGRQNTNPDIPVATAAVSAKTPSQRVFAVGLGLNQLEDKLQQIASVTNGIAQITGDLVGYKEFLLQKLYVQILSDLSSEAFVRDPRSIVLPGQRRSTPVDISEVDVAADFIVVFRQERRFPKYMNVWLEAPDGTVIRPSDAVSLPNMEYVSGKGHMYFRWQFPAFPFRPQAHIGRWRIWVENFTGNQIPIIRSQQGTAGGSTLYYSAMSKARSNFLLDGRIVQTSYQPGSAMTVVLEPTLYGLPVELDTPVQVQVARPDDVVRTLELKRDEYGVYRGDFQDTERVGPYLVTAEVTATSPAGYLITRYRQLSGIIFIPGTSGGGNNNQDGDCNSDGGNGNNSKNCDEARQLLKQLSVVIERCCCEDEKKGALSSAELLTALRRALETEA